MYTIGFSNLIPPFFQIFEYNNTTNRSNENHLNDSQVIVSKELIHYCSTFNKIRVPALPSNASTASSNEQIIASLPISANWIAASILGNILPSGNCPSAT